MHILLLNLLYVLWCVVVFLYLSYILYLYQLIVVHFLLIVFLLDIHSYSLQIHYYNINSKIYYYILYYIIHHIFLILFYPLFLYLYLFLLLFVLFFFIKSSYLPDDNELLFDYIHFIIIYINIFLFQFYNIYYF